MMSSGWKRMRQILWSGVQHPISARLIQELSPHQRRDIRRVLNQGAELQPIAAAANRLFRFAQYWEGIRSLAPDHRG